MRASLCLLFCLAGCPGTLEDPDRFRGDFCPDVESELFPQRCSGGDCHDAIDSEAGLDLQSPNVAARLVGVAPQGEECMGAANLVVAGNPEGSLLYQKLLEEPPCGVRMPFIGDPLSDREIQCIAQWIEQLDNAPMADAGVSD